MMSIKSAYDKWAEQYDTNENKTRDLEGVALRTTLANIPIEYCLEIGCGTGKNTAWLLSKAKKVFAVDFSDEMLAKAKSKIQSDKVAFIHADINQDWKFASHNHYDLVTFSLVLEHIADLNQIFEKAASVLKPNGYLYIGELHPFRQYLGGKASFETENGLEEIDSYIHHVSDFTHAGIKHGFEIQLLNEFFDDDKTSLPRILTLLFKKANRP